MKKCRERYYNSTALYIIEKIFSNKKKYKNFFFYSRAHYKLYITIDLEIGLRNFLGDFDEQNRKKEKKKKEK